MNKATPKDMAGKPTNESDELIEELARIVTGDGDTAAGQSSASSPRPAPSAPRLRPAQPKAEPSATESGGESPSGPRPAATPASTAAQQQPAHKPSDAVMAEMRQRFEASAGAPKAPPPQAQTAQNQAPTQAAPQRAPSAAPRPAAPAASKPAAPQPVASPRPASAPGSNPFRFEVPASLRSDLSKRPQGPAFSINAQARKPAPESPAVQSAPAAPKAETAKPATPLDPIADIIAREEEAAPQPKQSRPESREAMSTERSVDNAPNRAAPKRFSLDSFELPEDLRTPAAAAKKPAKGDPLDEIERLIAETRSVDFQESGPSDNDAKQKERGTVAGQPVSASITTPIAAAAVPQSEPQDDAEDEDDTFDFAFEDEIDEEPEDEPVTALTRPAAAPQPRPEQAPQVQRRPVFDDAAREAEAAILAAAAADRVGRAEDGDDFDEDIDFDRTDRPAQSGGGIGRIAAPVLAVLLLAAAGGGVYWYLGQQAPTSEDVPLVLAQNTDVRQPAPQSEAEPESSVVFEQLGNQGEEAEPADEQIVSRDDTDGAAGSGVSRVITPSSDVGGLANRKVKTVTVRADGTIVSDSDATAGVEALPTNRPNVPQLPGSIDIAEGSPDSLGAVIEDLSTPGTASTATPPAQESASALGPVRVGVLDAGTGTTAADQVAIIGSPTPAGNGQTSAANDSAEDTGPVGRTANDLGLVAPTPIPRPAHLTGAGGVARVASNTQAPAALEPITLGSVESSSGPVSSAPVTTPAPTSSSGAPFYVQLASQGSQSDAQATIGELTNRYSSILGGRSMEIIRADLGGRGVWYRVGVPTSSLSEANQLCSSFKSAGADCIAQSR